MWKVLGFAILAMGCSEVDFVPPEPTVTGVSPDIAVDPPAVEFGALPVGEQAMMSVTVSNLGAAVLEISNVYLGPSPVFWTVLDIPALGLATDETTVIQVWYSATNVGDATVLTIESNDPDSPIIEVPVTGSAQLPMLEIDPDPYEFGAVTRTCMDSGTITLRNIGEAPLEIYNVAVAGDAMTSGELPALPVTLMPDDEVETEVLFTPAIVDFYTGILSIDSNDPRGVRNGEIWGSGEPLPKQTDTFEQILTDWTLADIFFYVDQSGSMDDDSANMADNWDLFTAFLLAGGIDYQVMVSTLDDGCHNGAIITPSTPNAADAFESYVVDGAYGADTEMGLTISLNAFEKTGAGECNDGFLRAYVNPIAVLVSDEPEQSANSWDFYVDRLIQISPALKINVVVTPQGGGCGDGTPGDGYFEAAWATGGAVLDICDSDWGSKFATIVQVEEPLDTFVLSDVPVDGTLVVTVNGYDSDDWAYDEDQNAIVFFDVAVPPPAAIIQATYEIEAECAVTTTAGTIVMP